jgi:alcohol dehydrogenase, propanol-preferring
MRKAYGEHQVRTQPTQRRERPTMRAAVITACGQPVETRDVPVPVPGPGQLLVRIETSGLCHTDLHAASGDWPVLPKLPLIPGHEGIGVVETVGPDTPSSLQGKRVAVPWLAATCGWCRYCLTGWQTLCRRQLNTGYTVDGTHAEYALAYANGVVEVPESVSSLEAAPLTCAGVTTYKAVKVARVTPAERVAVFGIGGLGHLAVQYARIVGGLVSAVDIDQSKLDLAAELGADQLVDARTTDPAEALRQVGGADVAVVLAASAKVYEQALRSLRRGGRLVMVALPGDDATVELPIFRTVLDGISVIGSVVGTRQDLAEVFALHAAGRTRVVAEPRQLADVGTCFEELLAGRVPARLVFQF